MLGSWRLCVSFDFPQSILRDNDLGASRFSGRDPRKQNAIGKVRGKEESKQRYIEAHYSGWGLHAVLGPSERLTVRCASELSL